MEFAEHPGTSRQPATSKLHTAKGAEWRCRNRCPGPRKGHSPLAEQRRHVVHRIEIAVVVMGIAGIEAVIARRAHRSGRMFRRPQPRQSRARTTPTSPGTPAAASARGRNHLSWAVRDPAGLPFGGLHQGGLRTPQRAIRSAAAGLPGLDPPVIGSPRDESAPRCRASRPRGGLPAISPEFQMSG